MLQKVTCCLLLCTIWYSVKKEPTGSYLSWLFFAPLVRYALIQSVSLDTPLPISFRGVNTVGVKLISDPLKIFDN